MIRNFFPVIFAKIELNPTPKMYTKNRNKLLTRIAMRELNKCIPSLKPLKKEEINPLKILPMEIPLKQFTKNCDSTCNKHHMKISP